MNDQGPAGVGGWLLVYLCGSVPYLLFHAAGLSGWFFDYPHWLTVALFLLLASPLALLLSKSPRAPLWNVVAVWVVALVIALRAAGVPFTDRTEAAARRSPEEWTAAIAILAVIVALSLAWAAIWTVYFRRSIRVRNTFPAAE